MIPELRLSCCEQSQYLLSETVRQVWDESHQKFYFIPVNFEVSIWNPNRDVKYALGYQLETWLTQTSAQPQNPQKNHSPLGYIRSQARGRRQITIQISGSMTVSDFLQYTAELLASLINVILCEWLMQCPLNTYEPKQTTTYNSLIEERPRGFLFSFRAWCIAPILIATWWWK